MAWTTTRRWSLLSTTLAGLVLALPGCKKKEEPSTPAPAEPPDKVTLIVHSKENSNRGRPLHVVVRSVTRKRFVEDGYSTIARLVVEPDETVIHTLVVLPNENQLVPLTLKNKSEAIGIYGLFTRGAGESWKLLAERPMTIEVWLGESAIERRMVVERDAPTGK